MDHYKSDSKTVFFIRNVPKPLRDQFKTQTARRGTNMSRAIMEFVRAYIKSEGRVMDSVKKSK